MRKFAILIIVLVVGAYLVGAHKNQHRYSVPGYNAFELDILNGATSTQWNSKGYASQRHKRLSELGKDKLQPVEPVAVSSGRTVLPTDLLTAEDFDALTAVTTDRLKSMRKLKVQDSKAIRSFIERKFTLRQDIKTEDGTVLAKEGERITKPMVDTLLAAGITQVFVVGSGAVVTINTTVIMVILIFLGMTLILQDIFWEPVMNLIYRRRQELETGAKYLKNNVIETEALQEERAKGMRLLNRECLKRVADSRQLAMKDSETIINETRHKMHTLRQDAEQELEKTMGIAEEKIRSELPALTDSIVAAVTGKTN